MQALRDSHKQLVDKANAIVELAKEEGRAMSKEEMSDFDALMVKAEGMLATIERAAKADEARKLTSGAPETQKPVDMAKAEAPAAVRFETNEREPETGECIGTIVRAASNFGRDKVGILAWAEGEFGARSKQYRALGATTFTGGGALIPENFVGSEFVELLRARSAFRRAGPRMIPLVGGTVTIPKQTGGATAYWVGESEVITASEQTFGQLTLAEKKLAVLTPISNDLLRNGGPMVDRLIRDDMVAVAANKEDTAFFTGAGTANEPRGVYYWVTSARRSNQTGTSLANVRTDIRIILNSFGNNHVPVDRLVFFSHTRPLNYAKWDLVDANSNFAFPELRQANPTLDGHPWFTTNNLANSQIYAVNMDDAIVADGMAIELQVFDGGSYNTAATTVVSGVARDESVIRMIRKVDFGMRHSESGYVLESVTWGA